MPYECEKLIFRSREPTLLFVIDHQSATQEISFVNVGPRNTVSFPLRAGGCFTDVGHAPDTQPQHALNLFNPCHADQFCVELKASVVVKEPVFH